jgi:SagB-type dehydrogenase family enzyme
MHETEGIGEIFQQETKLRRHGSPRGFLDLKNIPTACKEFPGHPVIPLPDHRKLRTPTLAKLLRERKSCRRFSTHSLSLLQASFLLWCSGGPQRTEHGHQFRTVPSAGALYPCETYLIANRVQDLTPGLYHYQVRTHSLIELFRKDLGPDLSRAAMAQGLCQEAAAVFLWTGVVPRSRWKYGQRAYRYLYLDAGHLGQNLALGATALGLGSCPVGAFFDAEIDRILEIDGTDETILYLSVVGQPF